MLQPVGLPCLIVAQILSWLISPTKVMELIQLLKKGFFEGVLFLLNLLCTEKMKNN